MPISDSLAGLGVDKFIPKGISGTSVLNMAVWLIGSIVVAMMIVAGIIILFMIMKYNKKAKIFQKVGNKIVLKISSKACYEKVGRSGDRMFFIKSLKKYTKEPSIQMAKNEYWFFEREDGELINFCLADFDEIMKKAGAFYVDFDMRMARLGIEKNLKERHLKERFWDKYGTTIMNILAFLILTIGLVVFFWQLNKLMVSLEGLVGAMNGYIDAFNNIVSKEVVSVVWLIIGY